MLNGIIIIKKEQAYTSNDVVAKLRGICHQQKIGHTGTLDPNATGVLPVCLGNATKLCDMLTDKTKEYRARLLLGKTTDTQDIWGSVLTDSGETWKKLSGEKIRETVLSFQGKQKQIPPMYSAIKINGKKLYELARQGMEVERKPREIEIREIEILSVELPELSIRVDCSKGTYIRTLCHDIGEKLGCGAVMSSLMRTRVGDFSIEEAYTLEEVERLSQEGRLEEIIRPAEECFEEYPAVHIAEKGRKYLENGNEIGFSFLTEKPSGDYLRVYDETGVFYGIYFVLKEKGRLKPWKMFFPEKE